MNPEACAPPAVPGLAARLLADTDCQAFGLVERGYAALAQPGSPISALLTGLLVLAVAVFGYRLLLGRGLHLSDAIGLTVKIGVVLVIATSWASWQTLAYDSLARAPTRIAGELLNGINARDPLVSLQSALNGLEAAGVGYRTRAGIASPLVGGPAAAAMTLNISALLLTLAIVGVLVVARVVLALLLAIAPVMAGFILFDGTRGMAEGWLGAMVAAALAPLFVLTLAAVELAIMVPLITRLLAEQTAGRFDTASVTPIGLVALVFAIAMLVAVRAGGRIARGIRLPREAVLRKLAEPGTLQPSLAPETLIAAQSSAARVAQALDGVARRESDTRGTSSRFVVAALGSNANRASRSGDMSAQGAGALGKQNPPLRRAPRGSRAASRRDA